MGACAGKKLWLQPWKYIIEQIKTNCGLTVFFFFLLLKLITVMVFNSVYGINSIY